jgi:hypothetical protein
MSDEPLLPNDANLAILASRHAADPFLQELAQRADIGAGVGVGLLVNGMVVMGGLAQPEEMAKQIDAEWAAAISRSEMPEDTSEEEWAATRERVATRETRGAEERREQIAQLDADAKELGEGGLDLYTSPADIARRALIANAYSHLTITKAHIFAPGQVGVTAIDLMRVAVDQISGWWLLRTDEDGGNHTALWQTDLPGVTYGPQG